MADFDSLTHEQQLPVLLELAEAATKLYALPEGVSVKLINLSENATYKVEATDGRAGRCAFIVTGIIRKPRLRPSLHG